MAEPQGKAPIGVFDSGMGGLTVVRALQEALPDERFLYYGDTAHLPYGDKSPEVLRGYVRNVVGFLLSRGAKAIVVACNTASAVAFQAVAKQAAAAQVPAFEVIEPAVELALAASEDQEIGVIATQTTILSHIYLKRVLAHNPKALVVEKATPLLVPLIEEGWLAHKLSSQVVQAYMSDTSFRTIDTLILGCTHYPLIAGHIQRYFEQNLTKMIRLISSSEALAQTLPNDPAFRPAAPNAPRLPDEYYVSDRTEAFAEMATRFLGFRPQLIQMPLPTSSSA